jgi:RNA polymerase sigma-70 factor (sigma-E family)
MAVLLVRDVGTAEEVVQDAFVAMHGRWGRLRDNDLALAYLRQTVVNRSRSVLRHRAVVDRHVRSTDPRTSTAASSDTGALDRARREAVLEALGQLPDRQREVLVLRHYLELSEAEIADALDIARGSVKSHASRGSAALRALLGDLENDET